MEKSRGIKDIYDLVQRKKLPHAMIFEAQDIEKGLSECMELCKAILCKSGGDEPCGKCLNCIKLCKMVHPDVITIDVSGKSSSIGVDDIRFIISDAYKAPNEAEYKIYIIKNGGETTPAAQNAILKMLEEPPGYVFFMILCNSVMSILETIRSRAWIFSGIGCLSEIKPTKSQDIADKLLMAIASGSEFALLEASAPLLKDKLLLDNTLDELEMRLKKLCVAKIGVEPRDGFSDIMDKSVDAFDMGKLLGAIEICVGSKKLLERNVNNGIIVNYFCAKAGSLNIV